MKLARVCAVLFCICEFVSASDFKIGPDGALDSLAIAAGRERYLVIWRDLRGAPRMTAATVSTTGAISADVPISDAAGVPLESPVQRTTIACDGTNWLAVWADNRGGAPGIRGVLLNPQGVPLGADFQIGAISRTDNLAPQVVYTGVDYVVAWQDNPQSATGTQIYFARVSTAGVAGARSASAAGQNPSQSLEFVVTGFTSEALLVWQDLAANPNVTRATRIAVDNSIIGPPDGTLLFNRDFGTNGFGAPIGALFDSAQYVVLSSYGAQIDSSVFKTTLTAGGVVVRSSAPFAEVGQGKTGLAEDNFPRTFSNGGSEFLFVRNSKVSETAWHLLTKRVALDGKDRDPNLPLIDSASRGVLNGAVAAAMGTQYLAAWMDGRAPEFQPARQTNIYGLLIDSTQPGDESLPYLKAQARARPIFGSAPLTVSFGTYGSTGIVDSIGWDFGDGAADTLGYTTHKYEQQGTFLAVLALHRAGFAMRDFVRILVDVNALGGGGGPPESLGGVLGPLSDGIVTEFIPTTVSATRDFTKTGADALRFYGFFDPSVTPVSVADKEGKLTFAGKTYSFKLSAEGLYTAPAGQTPLVRVQFNRYSGAFLMTVTAEDFAEALGALGAANETVAKPGKQIVVPYSVSLDTVAVTSTLTMLYQAQAGKKGTASYAIGVSGYPGHGFMRVFGASAAETGKAEKSHTFAATGRVGFGNGRKVVKSENGIWRITLGNFVQDIPTAKLTPTSNSVYFVGSKGSVGVTQFAYNAVTGVFAAQLKLVPAEGASFSGMPLASSFISRADMALSFDWDLEGGEKLQASGYMRLARQKAGQKKWKLR